MTATNPRPARRRIVRPANTVARPMASDPAARELHLVTNPTFEASVAVIGDENGMDLDEVALHNLGIVPEVPMSEIARRARRAAQDQFIPVEELSDEDILGKEFHSFDEEPCVDTDPDPDTDTDPDDGEEIEPEYEGTPQPNDREVARYEQMAREADVEDRDRKAVDKAKAHLAAMAARKSPRPAPTPQAAPPAPTQAEPTPTEKLQALRDAFTSAVQAKDFTKADSLDAQIKVLVAEIEAEKAKVEKAEAKEAEIKEGEAAEKRLGFLRGKVAELRTVLMDRTKEIGDLIAISSALARYEYEMKELEPKAAVFQKARAEAQAKREAQVAPKPTPAPKVAPAPKTNRRLCKVCGKEIEGDVMVPHFGEIERRRGICLEPDMTAEQLYGDLFFHPACMHAQRVGIQGRAYTLGSGYKKGLEIWCNGRGRRAQAAEERKLSRENPSRADDMSRPPRQWTAAPRGTWRRTA